MRRMQWGALVLAGLGLWLVSPSPFAASEVIQGSPVLTVLPVDAIPAIDHPTFVSAAAADPFMQPDEVVLSLPEGDAARAYSAWQLNHHEIVNDTVEGRPVAITW